MQVTTWNCISKFNLYWVYIVVTTRSVTCLGVRNWLGNYILGMDMVSKSVEVEMLFYIVTYKHTMYMYKAWKNKANSISCAYKLR